MAALRGLKPRLRHRWIAPKDSLTCYVSSGPELALFLDATALQRRRRVGVPHLRKLVRRLRRGARSTPAKRRARRMQRRPRRRRGGDAPRVAALDRDIALKSTPVKGRRY